MEPDRTAADIARLFEAAGCQGALHAIALSSGAEFGLEADAPMVMASVLKTPVALEFYAQVEAGLLDGAQAIELQPGDITPGATGISNFQDPVRMSLRDLASMMMTISDNAATDRLIGAVGLDAVNARLQACGCVATVLESDLMSLLDGVAVEMGVASYAELLGAQSGRLGPAARAQSTDPLRVGAVAALDPMRTSHTTARDMTRLLAAIWNDTAAPPAACAAVREVMARQVTRRLEAAVADGGSLAAKSGGLFGRVRNEIGVVGDPDGRRYAVAVFTHAHAAFAGVAQINAAMGEAARRAIAVLRAG